MDIFNFLNKYKSETEKVAKSESFNADQLNNIKIAHAEADDFESANDFSDFVDGGADVNIDNDISMDDGSSMGGDDMGFDDNMGLDDPMGGQDQEGNISKAAIDFLEDLDESEVPIVGKLLSSMSTLYHKQKLVYNKILTSNLEASDFNASVEEIKDQYRVSLLMLRNYITNKYHDESTVYRVETFIKFKNIFTKLSLAVNDILDNIKKK